jgi:hypothetical protein
MSMSDEQVAALMQTWRDALAKQIDEMKLRQWCVEQSIKYAATGVKYDPIILLQFITAPFAETFQRSEAPIDGT